MEINPNQKFHIPKHIKNMHQNASQRTKEMHVDA